MIRYQSVVCCDHDGCTNTVASDPGQLNSMWVEPVHVRGVAQGFGWLTRRKHSGIDLCPAHRGVS